ncbi:hypothetical protein BaRGS_00013854 [Batillaria attramentaria]|uniref:Uncharacterized protein n=1 Tax=Batillaria attramentaria TaxID=370345 RepID=A0ABD0L6L9_9CAEN
MGDGGLDMEIDQHVVEQNVCVIYLRNANHLSRSLQVVLTENGGLGTKWRLETLEGEGELGLGVWMMGTGVQLRVVPSSITDS